MLPYSLFLSLAYWIYPLKDYIGETGCYLAIYSRDIGHCITSTHSFFMAMFRYNCLFNGHFLKKINLSPNVSSCFKSGQTKMLYSLYMYTCPLVFGCWELSHVIFLKLRKRELLAKNHVTQLPTAKN